MIRAEPNATRRSSINPLRGEFEVPVGGDLCRFDTRLSTVAAIEAACGDRAIVEILNGIILGRRARDVVALLAAALAIADPAGHDAEERAARTTVGEAEGFVLALVFALGFKVGKAEGEGGRQSPLDVTSSGNAGGNSRSAG